MAWITMTLTEQIKRKLDPYGEFAKWVMRGPSGLSLVQRQMIATLTSAVNQCRY